jgi:hypothetical protein
MILEKPREWLNDHTKRIGGKLTPQRVKDKLGGDLGDFLTADLNTAPRIGAAVATMFPGYVAYRVLPIVDQVYNINTNPEMFPERLAMAASIYINPVTIPAVAIYVGLGWLGGKVMERAIDTFSNPSNKTQI